MIQNITWYLGYNAVGKTRRLSQLAIKAIDDNKKVVSNLVQCSLSNSTQQDSKKLVKLEESDNSLYNDIINGKLEANEEYINHIKDLFNMICSKGDILIIDELDSNLKARDCVFIARAISTVRNLWDSIYITGREENLELVFTDFKDVRSAGEPNPNYHMIMNNGEDVSISEGQAYEYFDSI